MNEDNNSVQELDMYIFKRPEKEYNIRLDPVKEYVKQSSMYLSKINNIPIEDAVKTVKKVLKSHPIVNPIVKYKHKQANGDMEIETDTLTDYIKSTVAEGEVIVPSFTTYIHPSVKKSIHADFLAINIAARKKDKNEAFKYKQLGDSDKELYYTVMQKVRKVANNSLSGAYASKSTVLFNPSAHYTLTSITRCVASIGNSISESVIAGNKHFKNPETVINYISTVLTNINRTSVYYCLEKYKLYYPTVKDVMDSILYSSRSYWQDSEAEQQIYNYLSALDGMELAAVLYVNDLWHLKMYNEDTIRELLTKMTVKVHTGSTDNLKDIYNAPEGILNLVHHIFMDEIKGMKVDYEKLVGTELLMSLASTCKHITVILQDYIQLFRTFFTTDIMPPNIAYIREMIRDSIVLSDTDSTCGSYDWWVEWYFGQPTFGSAGAGLAAAVMTINTQVMDHNLKLFARNMNIPTDRVDLLKMKNEYYWSVFTRANTNKHYFANTLIQEGNVFAEPELELKGVHLIASSINQGLVKQGKGIIKEIHDILSRGEKLNMYKYVKMVADIERDIIAKVRGGDIAIFKKETIKHKKTYKNGVEKSPYFHHLVWQEAFAEKYGSPGEPMYIVIKIPLIMKSENDAKLFLDGIKDRAIATKWRATLDKCGKTKITSFKPPISIVSGSGIPEEIRDHINIRGIVKDNCNMFYIILETIGFYKKPGLLVSEMGY